MSMYIQSWDGGTGAADGVAITSSNTNGAGNTPIATPNTTAATFSSAEAHSGTLSAFWNTTASHALYSDTGISGTVPVGVQAAFREYFYFTSFQALMALVAIRTTSSPQMTVNVGATGLLTVNSSGGAALWTSTNILPLNSWVRIEVVYTVNTSSTGQLQVAYYAGDSTTAIEDSGAMTGKNLGSGTTSVYRFGSSVTQSTAFSYYRDDWAFSDSQPSGFIGPTNAPPAASFTASPSSGAAPLAVTFTDTSTNAPTSWSWAFGDGSTSTSQNPTYTYTTAGTYTATLTATGSGGPLTASNTITVVNAYSARLLQNWDGGTGATNGTTITTGNTNGPGNTPLSATSIGSAATLTFSSDYARSNAISAKFDQPGGSTGITYTTEAVTTTVGVRCVYRVYVFITVMPSATQWSFGNVYGNGHQVSGLFITTAGTIGFGLSSAIDTGVTMPLSQWVRVETGVVVGTTTADGKIDCAVFLNPDSTTPTYSSGILSSTTVGIDLVDTARLGGGTNISGARTWYLDDWAFDTNLPTGYIGPTVNGQMKTYVGGVFKAKPVKVWNGTAWAVKPLKRWDGTQWLETNY